MIAACLCWALRALRHARASAWGDCEQRPRTSTRAPPPTHHPPPTTTHHHPPPPTTTALQSDNSELHKREVTLADQSAKSVVVTLWGANATDVGARLEGQEGHVLLVTACKVGDYGGGRPALLLLG